MALNDRFHQMRGDVFSQMASLAPGAGSRGAQVTMADVRGDTAKSAVDALLRDRGVPITAENQQAALTYLLGGQLEGLSSQSTTASDIAQQALTESGDVSSAPPAVQSAPQSVTSPQPRPSSPNGAPDVTQTAPTMPNAPQPEVPPTYTQPGDTSAPATPASPNQVQPTQDGRPATEQNTSTGVSPGAPELTAALAAAGMTLETARRMKARRGTTGVAAVDAALDGEIVHEVPAKRPETSPGEARRAARTGRVPDSDVSVTVNPPRTDNALPAPPESVAIDDPLGSQPAIERGAPNVGQAQVVSTQEMMNAGVDPSAGQDMGDGLVSYRGTDGNVYVSDTLTGNNARLTADEAAAMTTQPGWRSIILKTLRGR